MSNEVDLRKQRKVEAEVSIDATGLATEAKQDSQITLATTLNTYVDGLEALLTDIESNTTGLNLEATQLLIKTAIDFIKLNTDNLDVALSTRLSTTDFQARINTLGQKVSASSTPVVLSTEQQAILQATLNELDGTGAGYLFMISQKITDQNDWANSQSTTTVAAGVTSVLLKSALTTRRQVTIRNTSTKNLYICMFTPATTATPFVLSKDEAWVFPKFRGAMYGIWDTGATGNAYITEEIAT